MRKIFLQIFLIIMIATLSAGANTINVTNTVYKVNTIKPKTPYISPSLKPYILEYKKGNYLGAMLGIEELLDKEKNNTAAKYYLALCYTQLGYSGEAQQLFTNLTQNKDSALIRYYSEKALSCIGNSDNEICKPRQTAQEKIKELKIADQEKAKKQQAEIAAKAKENKEEFDTDDITTFIRSGKKIHPDAMDAITKERMERKLQSDEYTKKQAEQNPRKSEADIPTNEEIAAALNTLAKIGFNPFEQNNLNSLTAYNNQFDYNLIGLNNPAYINSMVPTNSDLTKMLLYGQMSQQQNNMINYYGM